MPFWPACNIHLHVHQNTSHRCCFAAKTCLTGEPNYSEVYGYVLVRSVISAQKHRRVMVSDCSPFLCSCHGILVHDCSQPLWKVWLHTGEEHLEQLDAVNKPMGEVYFSIIQVTANSITEARSERFIIRHTELLVTLVKQHKQLIFKLRFHMYCTNLRSTSQKLLVAQGVSTPVTLSVLHNWNQPAVDCPQG